MTNKRCPRGMARQIIETAMEKHPNWSAKQIAESYPVGLSTCWREMREIRMEKSERLRESLQKAINEKPEPTREELKSNRWLLFAGVMAGIALMLMFVIFERGVH